jgi:hypothetical protein
LLFSIASTILWLLHLTMFASRAAARESERRHVGPSSAADADSTGRRAFIGTFTRAFVGVALATAVPGMALAWGECSGRLRCGFTQCSNTGIYCCPQGYPVLSGCDCKCYATVRDVMQTGCNVTNHCSSDF